MWRLLPAVCTFKWKWHLFYLEQKWLSLELYDSPEQHWQVLLFPHSIRFFISQNPRLLSQCINKTDFPAFLVIHKYLENTNVAAQKASKPEDEEGMYHFIKGIRNIKSLHYSWNLALSFWGPAASKTVCVKSNSHSD